MCPVLASGFSWPWMNRVGCRSSIMRRFRWSRRVRRRRSPRRGLIIGIGGRTKPRKTRNTRKKRRGHEGFRVPRMNIKTLLPELRKLVAELAEDLLARSTSDATIDSGLRDAFHQIERGGRTAQAFEVWREDYLDQVAVAWVLACVFVRFMEDNQLIDECWLAGEGERRKLAEDTHELFFREHPHDTDREYFQHVFKEVGKIPAAKDLFAEGKTPLWAVAPSGDAAMKLLKFWREIDAGVGASEAVVPSRKRRHSLPGRPLSGTLRAGQEEICSAANAGVRGRVHSGPYPHACD